MSEDSAAWGPPRIMIHGKANHCSLNRLVLTLNTLVKNPQGATACHLFLAMSCEGTVLMRTRRRSSVLRRSSLTNGRRESVILSELMHLASPVRRFWRVRLVGYVHHFCGSKSVPAESP